MEDYMSKFKRIILFAFCLFFLAISGTCFAAQETVATRAGGSDQIAPVSGGEEGLDLDAQVPSIGMLPPLYVDEAIAGRDSGLPVPGEALDRDVTHKSMTTPGLGGTRNRKTPAYLARKAQQAKEWRGRRKAKQLRLEQELASMKQRAETLSKEKADLQEEIQRLKRRSIFQNRVYRSALRLMRARLPEVVAASVVLGAPTIVPAAVLASAAPMAESAEEEAGI
jgi:hypothetical protein